jgi:nucleotide-binding universal stress UspA family protein
MTTPPTILLCTDGSDLSIRALADGLRLLPVEATRILVTVIDDLDESLVTGASGFAGGTMSPTEFDTLVEHTRSEGEHLVAGVANTLGIPDAETRVIRGQAAHAGGALCALAADIRADVIVMGSRGMGGLKRALLGSVSDHVVRHAPCSVLITREPL